MGQLLSAPIFTALDQNGDPIAGALLYAYLTGTTTPTSLYQDATLATPHAVPVVADSGGRFPAIYFNQSVKLVLNTALGVLVKSIDPVTAPGGVFTASGIGATAGSAVETRFGDQPNAIRDFGAAGDGTTDDTAALQAFVNACQTYKKAGHIPGTANYYKVTAPIVLSGNAGSFYGDGTDSTKLQASGNFDSVFQLSGTATNKEIHDLWVLTSGTTTKAINAQAVSAGHLFHRVRCQGDLTGALVASAAAGYLTFDQCRIESDNVATIGVVLDMNNQGTRFINQTTFDGVGNGLQITKSSTGPRVEGVSIIGAQFLNTGPVALDIGNSLLTQVLGCNIDQAGTTAVLIRSGADDVLVVGNWIGMVNGSTGRCLSISADVQGGGHQIMGNTFWGGDAGIAVDASASVRIAGIGIIGNTFSNHAAYSLLLDSVNSCKVIGNTEKGSPSLGSWNTLGTNASKGSYQFDNNGWAATAPNSYDTGSTYRFGNDTGIVGRNKGANTPGSSVTSLTVSHGLFHAPSKIIVTPNGAAGAFNVLNVTSTTFDIGWGTSGAPTWYWDVEV